MQANFSLSNLSIAELKKTAIALNAKVEGDRRLRETWIRAIEVAQEMLGQVAEVVEAIAYSNIPQQVAEAYEAIDQWRQEAAEIDMTVVAGHYAGTLYADYRKGLQYLSYVWQFVVAIVDSFVQAHQEGAEENRAIALAIYTSNQIVLSDEIRCVSPYLHEHFLEFVRRKVGAIAREKVGQFQRWTLQPFNPVLVRLGLAIAE